MMVELASGFAVVGAGAWLFGRAQPAAVRGALKSRGLKGFICPDRGALTRGELAEGGESRAASAGIESRVERAETMRSRDWGSPLRGLEPSGEADSEHTQDGAVRSLRDNQNPEDGANGPRAWCASADRPFLTRLDCGVPVTAVSDKVLVAPAAARTGARLLRVVPMSFARSIRTTEFSSEWVVMATRSRTARVALADGESLGVRPEAAVAWTGARPSGFCPRLRLLDILLPRGPRDLMLHFHGPAIVWIEGSEPLPLRTAAPRRAVF